MTRVHTTPVISTDREKSPLFHTEEISPAGRDDTGVIRRRVVSGEASMKKHHESKLKAYHPDYVVINAANEIYANAAAWVAENLTFIT